MTKDLKWHALKLIGIMEHGVDNVVALYTMTENFETGTNHIIECLHGYLNYRNAKRNLPKVLSLQIDNFTRENKNR